MQTEKYLTFNPAFDGESSIHLVPIENGSDAARPSEKVKASVPEKDGSDKNVLSNLANAIQSPTSSSLALQYEWTVWEQVQRTSGDRHDYKQTTRQIASFSTVEGFWRLFNSLPQPSELLVSGKRMIRDEGAREPVDAIMIFRHGIEPMWEDPENANGGHFDYKVNPNLYPALADEYWNNLVLGIIGGTIEPSDMITGIRLVDKLERSIIRLELWFTNQTKEQKAKLERNAMRLMTTKLSGGVAKDLECVEKSHSKRR